MNKINILCITFALLFVTACVFPAIALKQHKVQIVDAETGAPVPGAAVDLHEFPNAPEAPDPDHPHVTANAQGEMTIRGRAKPAVWQVRAEGYIEQQMSSNENTLPPRYAAHAAGGYDVDQVDGVIHLYQMPEPQLSILVSNTYVGPLTINLEPAPGFGYVLVDEINVAFVAVDPQASYIQGAAGRRDFAATASVEGVVDLAVTPLLYDIQIRQLQVRDGAGVLPHRDIANPQDTGRGVWGDANQDDKTLHHQIRLFVGTLQEYQVFLGSVH